MGKHLAYSMAGLPMLSAVALLSCSSSPAGAKLKQYCDPLHDVKSPPGGVQLTYTELYRSLMKILDVFERACQQG